MQAHRRLILLAAACGALSAAGMLGAGPANAQADAGAWPTRPVRLIIPAVAGSAPDIMARVIGEHLSRLWGQSVVIDNKPGGGGLIAMTGAKIGTRDDHVFVLAPASTYAIAPYMYKSTNVDIVKDFAPVTLVGMGPMLLAVAANSPMNSVADVIAAARKQQDIVVATTSPYTLPHLSVDLLARAAGVPLRAATFSNGAQGVAAVVNGDATMIIDGVPPLDAMVQSGRLKALAVSSEARLAKRPQVPTLVESLSSPSLVINGWFGVVAPQGTRAQAIERFSRDAAKVLEIPDVVARLDTLGLVPAPMTPPQFGQFWNSERMRWEKVLKDVGAAPGQM
ncbi:MAG: Bug family tripartite tricarboxylate transporter substrate binding protein [Burkholderiaceae bacterium]